MNNNIKSTKQYADKIVDTDYKNSKNKNPFTQVAENAVKELSFTMRDGHIENNEGTKRSDSWIKKSKTDTREGRRNPLLNA